MKSFYPLFCQPVLALVFILFSIHAKAQHCKLGILGEPNFCDLDFVTLVAFPWGSNNPPYTYLWSNGATDSTISVANVPSTYSVTVTDAVGCTISQSYDLFASPDSFAIIDHCCFFCPGQTIAIEVMWILNQPPNATYLWSNGETESLFTTTEPGIYSVTISDPDNGCSQVLTDTIEYLPTPQPEIVGPSTLCAGQTATLTVSGGSFVSYFWFPGGSGAPTLEVSSPGEYIVMVTEAGNICGGLDTINIAAGSENLPPPQLTAPANLCPGQTGIVEVTNSASYDSFLWSTGETTPSITANGPGTYVVTVSDAGGCTGSGSVVVGNTSSPILSTAATAATCGESNGSVDLSVSPPGTYTYLWSNGATSEDLQNVAPGSYSVTATDANGCSATATASVSNTTITFSISGNVTQPSNGQNNGAIDLTVSPSGTYDYNWSNGATTQDLANLSAGTYTVTVSAGGTCTATASFSLSVVCPFFFDYNSYFNFCDPTLIYVEAIPIAGTPPYTYLWETGETTQTIIVPNVTDDYFVTITDASGCVIIDHAHIKPQAPGPSYPYNNNGCEPDTVTLFMDWIRDSFPGTTYLWSTGATTPTIDITTSGNYFVTITSPPNGCTYVAQVDFTFHPEPQPEIVGPTTLCPGNSATLSVTGGNFASIYWYPQEVYQPTVEVNTPGDYVVYAWFPGVGFCPGADTITIVAGSISPPVLTGPSTLCSGQNGTVNISNASDYMEFLWDTGATTSSISVNAPGTYLVTVTNAGGCTATGSFNVTNDPNAPNASTESAPAICGENNGSVDLTVSPPGSYTYLWSNGSTSEDLSNLPAGTYSVTVTSGGGCSGTSTAVVPGNTVNIALSSNTTPNTSCIVNTGGIDLNVSPPGVYTFDWSNGATTEDLLNVAPGSYSVTVSTGLTCSSSAIFTVEDNPIVPNLTADPSPATCNQSNGSIDLSASGSNSPFTFDWSNGSTSEDLSDLAPGNYSVTVTGSNGCTSTETATVNSQTVLVSVNGATSPNTECGGGNGSIDITPTPSGIYDFVWSNGAATEDLFDLPPGTYSVTATLGGNCIGTAAFVVEDNSAQPTASGIVAPNTSCNSASGGIDLTVSSPGAYAFSWSNGAATEDLSGIAAGSYSVTVTGGNNCSSTANFEVTNAVTSSALTFATTSATCGQNDGIVSLNISPSGTYIFLWSNGASSQNLQNVAAGTYLVTVTSSQGCTSTGSAEVANESTGFTLSGATTANTICTGTNGAVDLTISPSGNYAIIWSNGAASEDLQNVAAGSYSVTVTGGNGCTATASAAVANNSDAPALATATSPGFCGQNSGAIDLTVSPSGNYTIAWSNGASVEDLQNVGAGSYSVTVTGSNGCTATGTFEVPNNSSNFTLNGVANASTTCTGGGGNGSIDLNPDPPVPGSGLGYSFIWSNGATAQNLIALPAGTYSVTVSDGTSCTASASYTITSNAPTVNLSGVATPVACFGGNNGAIILNPSGGAAPYVFAWSPALPGNLQNPSNLAAGAYSVTATDENGCLASAVFAISQPGSGVSMACQTTANASVPGASDGSGSVSATGGTAPYFISWTPGGGFNQPMPGGSFALNNLAEGSYFVTVTDANGCPENCSFQVVSGSPPCVAAVGTMQAELLTACETDCISASYDDFGQILDNGQVVQFILHQGSASQIVGEIARNAEPVFCFDASQMMFGTTYFISAVVGVGDSASNVILTDPCTAASLGTPVIFYEKPAASAASENITCLQNKAQLSGISSLPGSQFQWTTQGGTFTGNTTAANATATSAGIYTLFVSKNGCADTAEVQVFDLRNQPVAAIDSDSDNTLNCSVDAILLTGSSAGSSDGSMFWFSNGNLIGTGSSLTVQQAGIYQFVILDTVTFCGDTAEMQILENQTYPPVFVNTPPVLNCQQTSVTLTGGSTVGGIEFAWASIAGADTTILGAGTNLTVSAPGTYFLIATDLENGCTNAASQAVFANTDPPQADAGENQTLDCHESPVTLTGSSFPDNVSFAWSSPWVNILAPNSVSISVNEPGIYILVVQRQDNFCTDTSTVQVFDYQTAVQVQVTIEPPTCNGDGNGSIFIETDPANAPYEFVANGKSYGSNPHLMALSAGTYSLQVTDNQGCTWTAEGIVPDPPVLELNLGADLFVELGQTVTLTAQVTVPPSALEAVLWQPDSLFDCAVGICLQQEITPVEQTEVRLTVIDTFGCKATDRLMLFVKKDVDVYIPNVFSPNGDGVNDVFTLYGDPSEIEEIVDFQIFQRWGEFVYKYEHFPPNDPLYGWDGTFNGTPLNSQVFVYWVVVKFTDGTERFFEGGITLLR